MTDGITIVGVLMECVILKPALEKNLSIGITTAVYKANNIVSSLQNSNFKVISNPYYNIVNQLMVTLIQTLLMLRLCFIMVIVRS